MKRIYHTWDKWECFPAGFYDTQTRAEGEPSKEECEKIYAELLRDDALFRETLCRVLAEWPRSCEHYLSNDRMNRIAWLGQASLCLARSIPSAYRGGFNLLSKEEQERANQSALWALNKWLTEHGELEVDMAGAGVNSKADLY